MSDHIGSLDNTLTISGGDTELTIELAGQCNLRIGVRDLETGSSRNILLDAEETKLFRTVLASYANRIHSIAIT